MEMKRTVKPLLDDSADRSRCVVGVWVGMCLQLNEGAMMS